MPRPLRLFILLGALTVLAFSALPAQEAAPDCAASDDPRREDACRNLYGLIEREWEWRIRNHPELATYLGLPGRNDRWTDHSMEAIERRRADRRALLRELSAHERDDLPEEHRLTYDLFRRELEMEVEGQRFPSQYLPVDQMDGIQKSIAQTLEIQPRRTVEDLEDALARLQAVPRLLEQVTALLEEGRRSGVIHARVPLRDVPDQITGLIPADPLESPLLDPFVDPGPEVGEEAARRLQERAAEAYRSGARPAYERFRAYLLDTYLPSARTDEVGWSAVPAGREWYAYNVRRETTTDLTPAEIHEIGLREVGRIRAEMEAVIEEVGFQGSFEDFVEFLQTDPRFFHETPEALVAEYRAIAKRADPALVPLFGRLPRLQYGVEPMADFYAASETTARYRGGSLDAGRAGTYLVNTYDLSSRPRWEMEALSLHEAVPGHHLQIALAQELEGLPDFRRFGGPTAFVEGWALYAETLGDEMGFYEDPYSRFGALTYQMWRAVRLVVDTGIHAMGWTRQEAIDFFKANSSKPEHDIVVEIDRYIVWPGQALAYMIGKLKIEELRAHAETELGEDFDVRAFHDHVLGAGAIPLDVLEERMRAWVTERRGG